MPISHNVKIKPITADDFHSLDYEVMSVVFSMHKDLGRFYEERIYQNELAYRCIKMGFGSVDTEVPIHVSYRNFEKVYYMDMVIDNRVVYELKTVESITGQHRKQALNYLLLMGMQHGKVVNMRPQSVQSYFISSRLTPDKRKEFTISDQGWKNLDEDSIWLKQLMIELISEWGVFLDTILFYDAVRFFSGGDESVLRRIEVFNDSRFLGTQMVHLLNPEIALNISAVSKGVVFYKQHLLKFLSHTSLKAIQWINFNHAEVQFITITNAAAST